MYPQTSAQLSSCFLRPWIPSEVENKTSLWLILYSKSMLFGRRLQPAICTHHIYSTFDTNLKSEHFLRKAAHKSTSQQMDETISILQLFTLSLFHYREASGHRIYRLDVQERNRCSFLVQCGSASLILQHLLVGESCFIYAQNCEQLNVTWLKT